MLRKLFVFVVCLVAAVATASAQTPPDNEIWYTTTDGKMISKSFDTDDLVSHNYNNGRGVLKFRNSITRIERLAFQDCSSLTSITIPNSVTSIGNSAFNGCSSLKSFKGKFASEDGRCLIKDGELIAFAPAVLTSYTIPNSVTSIGWGAFAYCSSLTSITIPNSVTEIGGYAFRGCSSLTSITIPNSVTSIGDEAFEGCSSLKSVKVANKYCYDYFKKLGVPDITFIVSTPKEYEEAQQLGATKLAIDSNSKYASEDGLCLIDNGKLILFIGKDLTEYTIPESVTSIGKGAFNGCSRLKSVKVANKYCYDYFKNLGVPDITFIVSTPKEYEETQKIGATKLAIDSNSKYASEDGLCLINNGKLILFIGKDLTEYTIPESVTSFGEGAFNGCSSLKSVKVANKYSYDYFKDKVDDIAFYGANASADVRCLIVNGELQRFIGKGITEYSIPESVTSVGDNAFKNYNRLTSITIPDSVAEIGRGAFKGCSSLKSITIPNSVTSIENSAFNGCSSLTSITCLATTPPAIGNLWIGETTMMYVPKKAVKAYKKDPKWSRFAKQIKTIK